MVYTKKSREVVVIAGEEEEILGQSTCLYFSTSPISLRYNLTHFSDGHRGAE